MGVAVPPTSTTGETLPTAAQVGGKAAALYELERAGFAVPPFRVSPPDLAAAVQAIGGFPIAVRSSATVEDGRASSFAGQFESILRLETLAQVEEAVRTVKASASAPSVVEYCKKSGIDPASVRMEVIVQRQVRPELAGVAFTVNPVTGAEEVVIEAVAGLADDLLQGTAAPLPAGDARLERWRPEVEALARRVQRRCGAPQDVEFAIEGGVVYLLQARPITRIGFSADTGEWTNADFRDGGVSSGVCTPLLWSLYDLVWERALPDFLRELRVNPPGEEFVAGRMFFGRPYWNLGAVKRCLARLPGFVERDFDQDLSVAIDYEGPGLVTPITLLGLLRAVPTLFAMGKLFDAQRRFDEAFLAPSGAGSFEALIAPWSTVPAGLDAPALAARLRDLVEGPFRTTELGYFRTIFCASIAKLDFKDGFPDVDSTELCAALPELRHLAPTRALREMAARGETDVAPLLARFGHHSRRELDLRTPRWDEDRAFVEELLAQYRGTTPQGEDPRPAYEAARARARGSVSWWSRRSFDRKLDRLRRFVWLREEMRDCSSRVYAVIRRHVLALAAARGLGDDAFFMTWRELVDDDRRGVARAREVFESYRHFKAPNEIGSRYRLAPVSLEGALRGIGASQGAVEGVARVARTVEEAVRVEAGAVLVCPFTDPGWTPVLDRVSAVITETGGLLSHAAVICREYGIPAVLGIPGATERIPDGARVRVDGGRGHVELLGPKT